MRYTARIIKLTRKSYVSQVINNNQSNSAFFFSSTDEVFYPSKTMLTEFPSVNECDEIKSFSKYDKRLSPLW